MTDWSREVGPRKVGGRYYDGYWGQEYDVLNIDTNTGDWRGWSITIRWADGRESWHSTSWDPKRDRVVS